MPGKKIRGIFFLLVLWQLISMRIDPIILPSPLEVLDIFRREIFTISGLSETGVTLYRFFIAYLISVISGIFLGISLFRSNTLRNYLWPLITILQATPVISWVLLALLWFPSRMIPYFILGIFTLPIITINTFQGLKSTDEKLLEMASAYSIDEWGIFTKIMLPSMLPSFMSGVRITANSSLKVLATAEIIGRLPRGIGGKMNLAWTNIETDSLLAWTIYLVLLTGLLEKLIITSMKAKWGRYL
jgi:NitT/TauT family transport system permease protein